MKNTTNSGESVVDHSFSALAERGPNQKGEWLVGKGFLNRQQAMLITAGPGVGKSSLGFHWAARLVLGESFLGFKSAGPLKVLYVQNEDTEDDLANVARGVMVQVTPDAEEKSLLEESLMIRTVIGLSGDLFLEQLEVELLRTQPDIVILDPLFAFIGADAASQGAVTKFLRDGMAPLLRKFNCGWICIHHNKRERQGEGSGSKTFGSIEIQAFFRGIIELSPMKHGTVKLEVVKRARQADLRDQTGAPASMLYLVKGNEHITWEIGSSPVRAVTAASNKAATHSAVGRPLAASPEEINATAAKFRETKMPEWKVIEETAASLKISTRTVKRHLSPPESEVVEG